MGFSIVTQLSFRAIFTNMFVPYKPAANDPNGRGIPVPTAQTAFVNARTSNFLLSLSPTPTPISQLRYALLLPPSSNSLISTSFSVICFRIRYTFLFVFVECRIYVRGVLFAWLLRKCPKEKMSQGKNVPNI